jgi:hypothetical protein
VFTARYALSPYVDIRFIFKGVTTVHYVGRPCLVYAVATKSFSFLQSDNITEMRVYAARAPLYAPGLVYGNSL